MAEDCNVSKKKKITKAKVSISKKSLVLSQKKTKKGDFVKLVHHPLHQMDVGTLKQKLIVKDLTETGIPLLFDL